MSQIHSHLFEVFLRMLEHLTEAWGGISSITNAVASSHFKGNQFPLPAPLPRPMYSPVLRPRSLPLPGWRDMLWPFNTAGRVGWCLRLRSLGKNVIGIKLSGKNRRKTKHLISSNMLKYARSNNLKHFLSNYQRANMMIHSMMIEHNVCLGDFKKNRTATLQNGSQTLQAWPYANVKAKAASIDNHIWYKMYKYKYAYNSYQN